MSNRGSNEISDLKKSVLFILFNALILLLSRVLHLVKIVSSFKYLKTLLTYFLTNLLTYLLTYLLTHSMEKSPS